MCQLFVLVLGTKKKEKRTMEIERRRLRNSKRSFIESVYWIEKEWQRERFKFESQKIPNKTLDKKDCLEDSEVHKDS